MPANEKQKVLENGLPPAHSGGRPDLPAVAQSGLPSADAGDNVDALLVHPLLAQPVIALPVETEGQNPASPPATDGKSSVAMHIITDSLQFKLDTVVDQNQAAIELAAKLELALTLLEKTQKKLERTMIELGQLQAQLELQTQMQKALQEQLQKADQDPSETGGCKTR